MHHPLITAVLAMPKTHKCVSLYADGSEHVHPTRSERTAEMYAVLERRKIGRDLIDRDTGKTVRVVKVTVSEI